MPSTIQSLGNIPFSPGYKMPATNRRRKQYSRLPGMVTITPLSDVASRPAVAAKLLASDEVIARYTTVAYFDDFPGQANRGMLFSKADDVDIPAVYAAANARNVTVMHYNLEWPAHTWDQIRDQLILTRAALIAAGDVRPLIFGPIKTYLDTHIAAYAPSCDGFAWQIQLSPTLEQVPGFATTAVAASHAEIPGCPVYIQINAYTESEANIEYCARAVSAIPGVTEVNLYFGGAAYWTKAWNVLNRLRP